MNVIFLVINMVGGGGGREGRGGGEEGEKRVGGGLEDRNPEVKRVRSLHCTFQKLWISSNPFAKWWSPG